MSWTEVVGQDVTTTLLRRAVVTGRASHAYLFAGPTGVGKREAARVLAKVLNCAAPPAPGECCDRCIPCQNIDAGVFPDFLQVTKIKGRDIKIAQIVRRDPETDDLKATPVSTFLAHRPLEGRRSVVVVVDADQMNETAQNALLKTLEEPPEYAQFVLTTANPNGLLPTIRSRSQLVNFPPLPATVVAAALQKDGVAAEQARLLAALSGGSLGRARDLGCDEGLSRRRADAQAMLMGLAGQDDLGALGRAEEWEKRRDELPELLDLTLLWLRDALVIAEGCPEQLVVALDALPALQDLTGRAGRVRLMQMVDAVFSARKQLDRNANIRLVLDVLMLRLSGLAA